MVVPNSLKKIQMLYVKSLSKPNEGENSVKFVDNLHKKRLKTACLQGVNGKNL